MFVVLLCPGRDSGGGEETETRVVFVVLLCPRGDRGGGEEIETKNWFL